jgi:hypothetical protein
MSSGTHIDLYGVWGSSGHDVYVVGYLYSWRYGLEAAILHYDGRVWSTIIPDTGRPLPGVWCSSSTDPGPHEVYVVGDFGTIGHYDGSRWSGMRSGTITDLYGVWGSSGRDVYAVGDEGTILHYAPSPELTIRKDAVTGGYTPLGAPYRGIVTYTVALSNGGAADAAGTLFTDTLPVEVDLCSWLEQPSGTSVLDDEITWSGTVTAGEAITFRFVVDHVGEVGDVVTNTARYSHASGSGSDTATFTVKERRIVFLPLVTKISVP